jgi:hypothetical protein
MLVVVPATGLGITVFHHHCSASGKDTLSIYHRGLCSCNHSDESSTDNQEATCNLDTAPKEEAPQKSCCAHKSSKSTKHEHAQQATVAHSSQCAHDYKSLSQNVSLHAKHCCQTITKASSPAPVFFDAFNDGIFSLATQQANAVDSFGTVCALHLQKINIKPPPRPSQQNGIISFISHTSSVKSPEDVDSVC